MDLSRAVYSRDLKIAAMRALDAGATGRRNCAEIPTESHICWSAGAESGGPKAKLAFPGIGRRGAALPALDDARRIAELERKIGQLTMENDFLKKALQHFRDHHPPAVVNGADVCLKKSSKPRRKAKP